jgi:hypothetical protein
MCIHIWATCTHHVDIRTFVELLQKDNSFIPWVWEPRKPAVQNTATAVKTTA